MRFSAKPEEDYSLQLTSLIDVVFLLLIFFMVSTSFIDFTRRMDIQLPESKSSVPSVKRQNFLIEAGVDQRIALNGETITVEELERRLLASKGEAGRRTLTIKADKRLDYGFVLKLMGISFAAGIRDISVAVQE